MSALAALPATDDLATEKPERTPVFSKETRRIRARLDNVTTGIEQIFLGIGESLLASVGLLGEMREAFTAVTEAHASPELAEAEASIRGLLAECSHLLDGTRQESAIVVKLLRAITAAGPRVDELRQTVAMISAIAVNARVIAASMRNQGNSELTVFTDDVLDLARRASAVVERLIERQKRLRALLAEASSRSEAFERTFQDATGRLRERIEADLDAAVEDRRQAAKVSSSAESVSTRLSQDVSTIVAAMQIGDNTRQRLEHISAALAAGETEPEAEPLVIALECAQMEDARVRLLDESGTMRDAILGLSREIDHCFTDLQSELSKGSRRDGPGTNRLGPDIAQAAEELSRSQAEHEHVISLAKTIGDDVAAFGACSGEMRTLEFEMRLVSLNTAVTCSKLGQDGKALGVVSLQMRELVGEMVTRSEAVSTALADLGTISAELGRARRMLGEHGIAGLTADAERSLDFLSKVEERMNSAGSVLSAVGSRIAGLTSDAGAALESLGDLGNDLVAVEAELADRIAAEGPDDLAAANHAALFAGLRAAYTMEAERQIHDSMIADSPNAPERASPKSEAEDLDAILF